MDSIGCSKIPCMPRTVDRIGPHTHTSTWAPELTPTNRSDAPPTGWHDDRTGQNMDLLIKQWCSILGPILRENANNMNSSFSTIHLWWLSVTLSTTTYIAWKKHKYCRCRPLIVTLVYYEFSTLICATKLERVPHFCTKYSRDWKCSPVISSDDIIFTSF